MRWLARLRTFGRVDSRVYPMLFFRQEALEAVKKARKEAEEAARTQIEAEISRLKSETDAKVTELSTMLDQMQERVKAHDTKVDNEVCCTIFMDNLVFITFARPIGTTIILVIISGSHASIKETIKD